MADKLEQDDQVTHGARHDNGQGEHPESQQPLTDAEYDEDELETGDTVADEEIHAEPEASDDGVHGAEHEEETAGEPEAATARTPPSMTPGSPSTGTSFTRIRDLNRRLQSR